MGQARNIMDGNDGDFPANQVELWNATAASSC